VEIGMELELIKYQKIATVKLVRMIQTVALSFINVMQRDTPVMQGTIHALHGLVSVTPIVIFVMLLAIGFVRHITQETASLGLGRVLQ